MVVVAALVSLSLSFDFFLRRVGNRSALARHANSRVLALSLSWAPSVAAVVEDMLSVSDDGVRTFISTSNIVAE